VADVDGIWNIVLSTPMGAQNITLNLVTDGPALSGTASSPLGDQEFSGGTVDGDRVTLSMDITNPMPMTVSFNGLVEGDSVSGTATLGAFGAAPFTGTRG